MKRLLTPAAESGDTSGTDKWGCKFGIVHLGHIYAGSREQAAGARAEFRAAKHIYAISGKAPSGNGKFVRRLQAC